MVEKGCEDPTDEEITEAYENDPAFYISEAAKSRGEWCDGVVWR